MDLAALVEDMADLYGAVAEEKGIGWVYTAEPGLRIRGNRQLLAQAVGNLLDNAVKYTPEGGRIALNVKHEAAEIVLSVGDSGPGIPEDQRERVLERFVRLDAARSLPGNGLGLSLVKAVAKLHGAKLVLTDNNPGLCASLRFSQVLVS